MANERVLILGGTGYVGRALRGALVSGGAEVTSYSSKDIDCTWPAKNICMLDRLVGPDTTLVFASVLTPEKGRNGYGFMANVGMATSVASYLRSHTLGRCVYIGSDAVYGFDVNPVTEATPVEPRSPYGLAKYAGEKMIEWAALDSGVDFLSLRLTGIYGPGDPHGAYGPNSFARSLAHDRTIKMFGAGEEMRDHLYIDDVGRLGATLIRSGATGVVNLATGYSRSFAEIVQAIKKVVPYDFSVVTMPRTGPITHRHFDTRRLHGGNAVPSFVFTPFEEGLRATLQAFGAYD